MPAHVTTYGTAAAGGYRHRCTQCKLDRIVPGQRFKHICAASNEPSESCATCPTAEVPTANAEPPSLLSRLAGVIGASVRFCGAIVARRPLIVSSAEQDNRLTICRACEKFDCGKCQQCGCIVAVKAKLATEDCPLGFWPRKTER